MFPQLRERIGSALDLVVEFSTLGEYRLGADGAVWPASALALAPEREPQLGGAGDPLAERAAVRRIVAGGAAGTTPVATPAARRLIDAGAAAKRGRTAAKPPRLAPKPPRTAEKPVSAAAKPPLGREAGSLACRGERRHGRPDQPSRRAKPRHGAAAPPEQLCLAV